MSEYTTVYLRHKDMPLLKRKSIRLMKNAKVNLKKI